VTVNTEAADDVAIRSVSLLAGTNDGPMTIVQTLYEAPFNFVYRVPTGLNGAILNLNVRAVDSFGNVSEDAAIRLRTGEDQPPSIAIAHPADGAIVYEGKVLPVQAAAADDVGSSRWSSISTAGGSHGSRKTV
jgi:hypothetical protein